MVKTIKEKINDHLNKYKKSKSLKNRVNLNGKSVDVMGIARGKLFEMNGKFYPIFNSSGTLSKARKSKDFQKYEKALKENPSKEEYIKIATEVDKKLTPEVAGELYDLANNKEMKISSKDGSFKLKDKQPPKINEVARKRAEQPGIQLIDNRNLYVKRIENGEFGVYIKIKGEGIIFPLFKDIKTNTHKNTWSLVSAERTKEEKKLFSKMSRMSVKDATAEFYKFNMERGIPKKVIDRAFKATVEISDKKKEKIENFFKNLEPENNFRRQSNIGFNLNQIGFEVDKIENDEKDLTDKAKDYLASFFERNKKKDNDLEVMDLDTGEKQDINTGEPKTNRKLKSEPPPPPPPPGFKGIMPARKLENIPPRPPLSELSLPPGKQDLMDKEDAGLPPFEPDAIKSIPKPPEPEKIVSEPSPEEIARGEEERDRDKAGDVQEEEQAREELERDFIPDVSKFGHTMAVQNVFTRNNKDFTYFKNLVANTELKPSNDKKVRKMQVDRIIAEYSSLLPIEKVNSDYSYEECLEIVTLKYTYIQNIRFENSWKRALINFNMPNNNNIGNMQRALIVQQPMGTLGAMGAGQMGNKESPKEEPIPPMRTKKTSASGKVPAREHNIVAKPQMIKPKNTPKKQKIFNDRPMILNIRKRRIPDKLLYTNLRHQPNQQNMQQPGNLPIMRVKERKKKNRFKL